MRTALISAEVQPYPPETQEVVLEGNSPVLVQVLLYCGLDAGETCDSLAEQLADIDASFGSIEMDGPQGYGVYLVYLSGS